MIEKSILCPFIRVLSGTHKSYSKTNHMSVFEDVWVYITNGDMIYMIYEWRPDRKSHSLAPSRLSTLLEASIYVSTSTNSSWAFRSIEENC